MVIAIDNRAVHVGFRDVLAERQVLPEYGFGRWLDMRKICTPGEQRAAWIESHQKHAGWQVSVEGLGDGQWCRKTNDAASEGRRSFSGVMV